MERRGFIGMLFGGAAAALTTRRQHDLAELHDERRAQVEPEKQASSSPSNDTQFFGIRASDGTVWYLAASPAVEDE